MTPTTDRWLFDLFATPEPATAPPPVLLTLPAPPIVAPQALTRRYFYRCLGCLEIYALPESLPLSSSATVAQCDSCGAHLEFMGRTERDRLVQDHLRCACDDRCTSARGPLCTCKCQGANHGSGMAGYVTITVDHGPIPRVKSANPFRLDKSRQQYQAYRAALEIAIERSVSLERRKRAGEYLSSSDFDRLRTSRRMLTKAHQAKTHTARMKALAAVA